MPGTTADGLYYTGPRACALPALDSHGEAKTFPCWVCSARLGRGDLIFCIQTGCHGDQAGWKHVCAIGDCFANREVMCTNGNFLDDGETTDVLDGALETAAAAHAEEAAAAAMTAAAQTTTGDDSKDGEDGAAITPPRATMTAEAVEPTAAVEPEAQPEVEPAAPPVAVATARPVLTHATRESATARREAAAALEFSAEKQRETIAVAQAWIVSQLPKVQHNGQFGIEVRTFVCLCLSHSFSPLRTYHPLLCAHADWYWASCDGSYP